MAIQFYDEGEARDRRLQMLINAANSIEQNKIARDENKIRHRQLDLLDPRTNPYFRSELATENRQRMADIRYKEMLAKGLIEDKTSPSYQNLKIKKTEDLITTLYENQAQREMIQSAGESVQKLVKGLGGKITRGFEKRLNADDPLLGDYQKVKMALTNAQLRESLMLKGAISDTENKWLAEASANDELLSTPRATEVFNNILKKMDALDTAKLSSYKRNYGEDPSEWDEIKRLKSKSVDPRVQAALDAGYSMVKASEGKSESKPKKDTLGLFS